MFKVTWHELPKELPPVVGKGNYYLATDGERMMVAEPYWQENFKAESTLDWDVVGAWGYEFETDIIPTHWAELPELPLLTEKGLKESAKT